MVVLVSQQIFALGCICFGTFFGTVFGTFFGLGGVLRLQARSFLDGSISLLLARDLLEAVEFFSIQLVQFGVDVLDGVFCAGDNDMLAVGC